MKKLLLFLLFAATAGAVGVVTFAPQAIADFGVFSDREPDLPAIYRERNKSEVIPPEEKAAFQERRAEAFGLLRGLSKDQPADPQERIEAVGKMEQQEEELRARPDSAAKFGLLNAWTAIGPAPIIAGTARDSGRTIAIAIHPTNPSIVYVGTAQGGLYRTTDGGTNWTPLMDGALSLAIGAIAISPSNPETVYVGTGEPNFSLDSFFGVGVYRIDNASTTATLTGPYNRDGGNANVMTGRSVSEIIVHPTDANTIFVATTSGVGGISGSQNNVLPTRGIFRSTNAAGATPTFSKLTGLLANSDVSVRDIEIDPLDPNILVAGVVTAGPNGGIYRSTNALAASPTFTQTLSYTGTSTSELTTEFAVIHPAGDANATFYAATGNLGGRVLRSTDGGATWVQQVDNNFCTPQCFYDIAIAVDPTNANRVYLGGSPALIAGLSTNGGTSFTEAGQGVHVDTHALAVAPSDPTTVYVGTDGGIYKSTNSGASYTHRNNSQFFATQFMSIAVHPTDANFTIGGTQDNGTLFYNPAGTSWTRVDGGDGGYTVIDQNAADTTNVRMYHTYFNQTNNVVGYATRPTVNNSWTFRGCNGPTPANGITCTDAVLFYAPLESGPGNPNTVYYGTDRLYRTADTGLTHTVVSQAPIVSGVPLSSIGISRQNDNIRLVGLRNGGLWGTTTGSSTLVDMDPSNSIPNSFVARSEIDPTNSNTAYVTLSAFGVANVFKTTNLNATPPTWTNISGTIPQVPVSAFVIDPTNPNNLYAGTDIGVYASTDGGLTWTPFGTGLPRSAVFDMAIAPGSPRKLRIATHGKGMYEIPLTVRSRPGYLDFDGDVKTEISVFRPSVGEWWLTRSTNSTTFAAQFGNSSDTPIAADFTGDGKTDVAIFRPSNGNWFVLRSEDSNFYAFPFGVSGDIPLAGDFDGDGRADPAVFRPSSLTWFVNKSTGGTDIFTFGIAGDKPVVSDYDGDGRADIAIFRPAVGEWWIRRSSNGTVFAAQFGNSADRPVPGDYTGDGKSDIALFRPSNGNWFILRSEDSNFFAFPFGASGDLPVPGDYDGDGRFDAAVFRPSQATWYINGSTSGVAITAFGLATDVPVPHSVVP